MRLDEGQISAIIERELQDAQGYDSDVLSAKREKALEYYQCIMPAAAEGRSCLLYTSPSPRDRQRSRMPSSA